MAEDTILSTSGPVSYTHLATLAGEVAPVHLVAVIGGDVAGGGLAFAGRPGAALLLDSSLFLGEDRLIGRLTLGCLLYTSRCV